MRRAGHAEWTKLRTDTANAWLVLSLVALTVAVGAGVAMSSRCDAPGCGGDPARLSLTGVMAGQVAVAVLAVLTVGNEYGTGMMRTTLTAVPRRLTVLSAKAAVLTAVTLAAATVSVLGSLLIGRLVEPGRGFTREHGYPALSLTEGPTLRAAAGSVLYLALIGLLSLGLALAVRNSATAVGIVLALLFVFPVLAQVVADPDWQRHLQQFAPMTAGLAVQTTVGIGRPPIGPWQGLGVLALWAVAALTAGGRLLRLRDA
ncbi:ABC transporter permease [Streptomyces sp. GbtcB6]|uniref:ABC transporter permease n=1 Tax=Streptomyces sp. GbtcB6 TaxID=2824751 RepID=UPI001C2F4FF7|nr:ABC transporter permease [Streptomyces sp. GbtcB6]